MSGTTCPAPISGQTCSRTAATMAAFCSGGRARRELPESFRRVCQCWSPGLGFGLRHYSVQSGHLILPENERRGDDLG
jgi:hypothetical protein